MIGFKKKRIKTESAVNEVLHSTRVTSGILIDEAAHALRISKDYLVWLEAGEYDKLPGEVYVKNFIKAYGNYLHLNSEDLLLLYKNEKEIYKNIKNGKENVSSPVRLLSKFHFFSLPWLIRVGVVSCIAVFVLVYLGMKVEAIIRPPELLVITPASDVLIDGKYIEVQGTTQAGARVTINGQNALVNPDGSFSERINLSIGINEIKISAKKNHSNDNVVVRRVVVRETN